MQVEKTWQTMCNYQEQQKAWKRQQSPVNEEARNLCHNPKAWWSVKLMMVALRRSSIGNNSFSWVICSKLCRNLKPERDGFYNCIYILSWIDSTTVSYSSSRAEEDNAREHSSRACSLPPPRSHLPLAPRGFDTWHEVPQACVKT